MDPVQVAGDEVHLEVNALADAEGAEVGMSQRVRHDVDLEVDFSLRVADGVDGQADAVQRHRTLHCDEAGELARRAEGEHSGTFTRRAPRYRRHAVDVPAHQVSAEWRRQCQRRLEIDRQARAIAPDQRPRQCLDGYIEAQVVAAVKQGQADAVDGDAVAGPSRDFEIV